MAEATYRPLADYGLIGDCHTAALVSVDGSLDWLCVPRFDSPSLFARLLDAERGGFFAVRPLEPYRSEAAYVGYSGVLRTTFRTGKGVATLTDFMSVQPGSGPRPIARVRPQHRLIRIIEGLEGEVAFGVDFQPRPKYGLATPILSSVTGGVIVDAGQDGQVRLYAAFPLAIDGPSASGLVTVGAGERLALVLDLSGEEGTRELAQPSRAVHDLAETLAFWAAWAAGCQYRGPYEQAVMRSAVTLKLLTYSPTGAMVAAPTTSLPEVIGGVRNWDYRCTWIRDASLAAYALFLAVHVEDGEQFMGWVCDTALRCEPGQLQVVYGIDGERDLSEWTLDYLEGYRSSRPVRIGNAASQQVQLDVYGELLDCFHACRRFGQLTTDAIHRLWPAFAWQVDAAAQRWTEPDSGIWEVRSEPRQFVYSKAMAWVALDRGIKAAEELGLPADLARWRAERDAVRADVLEKGFDPTLGAFVRSYGERALDAANLLLPLVHFIDARDPRMQGTIAAIQRDLLVNGLVYRYLNAEDGLPGEEATFAVCTFWLVDNLCALGQLDAAKALFEHALALATPLGLYAEELDPRTGAHLGNFPQAFTHIGFINAAVNLARAGAGGQVRPTHGREEDVSGAAEL